MLRILSAYGRAGDPGYSIDESLGRVWHTVETWGDAPEVMVDNFCPSQNGNAAFIRWIARYQRQSASPADVRRQVESILGLDANQRLSEITAPTAGHERDRRSSDPSDDGSLPGR